ncbi:inhibitor of Bruton tyrosine kinase-like isoform X2 [Saccostrea echinata]|uniref:inhibitor of Bruton tyrosine kinase-like isoform X2 n=1 Tax=Saccostrea echinata TaxID=191078 RepID=UPI002A816636|nr:inhibitor of Bruton tyrosine kinase-like isoform X2 [Saccostrea echinata]
MPITFEPECGPKCRSKNHAYELVAAITKGNLQEVQAFARLCYASGHHNDMFGRSALHMAASCGKVEIVEWLLEEKGGDLTLKDVESGWTALHRAMFYGQLAVARLLIQYNSDLYTRDHLGLSPLDIAMKDRPPHISYDKGDLSDVYTWGDNTNLTLGHGKEQRRGHPEVIEEFRRNGVSVKEAVLCKYHSVFLTTDGQVYTCGHGQGGRLGHGNEQTYTVPRQVETLKGQICTQVVASRDHTVFLLTDGSVYSCGLNDSHQLGQSSTIPKSLIPKQVTGKNIKGKSIKGVCVGRFHTVLYTSDAVYTCGLNAGQLGQPKGAEKQTQLRQVSNLNHPDISIVMVSCSDAATVCMTTRGDIYVLHEYQCRKIATKWQEIQKILVSGGNLDHMSDLDVLRERGGTELRILLLNTSGKVFVWHAASPSLKRCRWAIRRQLTVTDVALSTSNVAIVTDNGEAFLGNFVVKKGGKETTQTAKDHETNDFELRLIDLLLKDEAEDVMLHRLPEIHRGTRIFMDPKGHNFCVLQSLPNSCLTDVPSTSQSEMVLHFKQLLEEADEFDMIHDIVLKVKGRSWAAHKFILLSRSDLFYKLIAEVKRRSTEEDQTTLEIPDENPEIFQQMLNYIYTDSCDLLQVGTVFDFKSVLTEKDCNENDFDGDYLSSFKGKSAFEVTQKKKGKEKKNMKTAMSEKDPVRLLQDNAKKFGVKGLAKRLDGIQWVNGQIQGKSKQQTKAPLRYDRSKLLDLCDVTIASDDRLEINCHKCVLVARLEYFNSMLSSGWVETSSTQALKLPVPGDCLRILIDFLYTDEAPGVTGSENLELICNVLVMADQLLVTRLVQICEVTLSVLVTMKNVGELLEFSTLYNAEQLKAVCQQYILINLPAILEGRYLDMISDEVMAELTRYYHNKVPSMSRRVITPFSDGPSKSFLEELTEDTSQITEGLMGDSSGKKSKPKKRRNRVKSVSEDEGWRDSRTDDRRERRTDRQISISSEKSLASDEEEEQKLAELTSKPSESITIPTTKGSQQESHHGSWTVAPKSPLVSPGSFSEKSFATSPPGISLKEIMEEEKSSQQQKVQLKNKKFSWKDVKRQQNQERKSQSRIREGGQDPQTLPTTQGTPQTTSAKPAWGGVSQTVTSFRDLITEDRNQSSQTKQHATMTTPQTKQHPTMTTPQKTQKHVLRWGLPQASGPQKPPSQRSLDESPATSPQSVDNPWIRAPSVQSPTGASVSFSDIVQDEIQKRESLARVTSKPLGLIQIEELAIQELLQHYKASDSTEEHITVERVPREMATPLWTSKSKSVSLQ